LNRRVHLDRYKANKQHVQLLLNM